MLRYSTMHTTMARRIQCGLIWLVILILLHIAVAVAVFDEKSYVLETKSLPDDLNFMPTLGNGHLGFTVFGDSIYMNGIYNGEGGDSRRARIPNWLNISISGGTENALQLLAPEYVMDLRAGYFRWTQTTTSGSVFLEQRVYAHRFYTRTLIYELSLTRINDKNNITDVPLNVKLLQRPGNESDDFDFVSATDDDDDDVLLSTNTIPTTSTSTSNSTKAKANDYKKLIGQTRRVEHKHFQASTKRIFIIFNDYWQNERLLHLPAGKRHLKYRYVLTIDEQLVIAQREMAQVLSETPKALLTKHIDAWETFWRNFCITMGNNMVLSQIVNAGIFYMASSLPSTQTFQPNAIYYGLSPTGLGRGHLAADYEGHNFWDTEIWMLPVVMQLETEWAHQLLNYRRNHLPGAQYNAALTGYQGARYPWESAYTGTEVTQPCCPEVAAQEVHISADIAIALESFYIVSGSGGGDRSWLCATAWPLLKEIAKFLASRVVFNNETREFHVHMVMGPDEDHWNVSDSVYTNVAFKRALDFASFAANVCDASYGIKSDYQQWLNISKNLHICYDRELDYHPEYIHYKRGTIVKQADVVLLGYPLQYAMNASTRRNDLEYYESVTRASGPAMSWSIFAINFLDINDYSKADQYFQKGFNDYIRSPFNVWSETKHGFPGSANFLTGIGGFLQALLNGYTGLRFHRNDQKSIMEVKPSRLTPATTTMTIDGIKFANARFTLHVRYTNVSTITCMHLGNMRLIIARGKNREPIHEGVTYHLSNTTVYIETVV